MHGQKDLDRTLTEVAGKLISIENHFDGCVFMELASVRKSKDSIKLNISITFGYHNQVVQTPKSSRFALWFKDEWKFQFSIRGGELELQLTNLSAPIKSREFTGSLNHTVCVEQSMHEETEATTSKEKSGGAKFEAGPSKASISSDMSNKMKAQEKGKFIASKKIEEKLFQIQAYGSNDHPKWAFRARGIDETLRGSIIDKILAVMTVEKVPCSLVATFHIGINDIKIQDVNGLKYFDASKERKFFIERLITKHLYMIIENSLNNCLSRIELHHV